MKIRHTIFTQFTLVEHWWFLITVLLLNVWYFICQKPNRKAHTHFLQRTAKILSLSESKRARWNFERNWIAIKNENVYKIFHVENQIYHTPHARTHVQMGIKQAKWATLTAIYSTKTTNWSIIKFNKFGGAFFVPPLTNGHKNQSGVLHFLCGLCVHHINFMLIWCQFL